jgi:hypothetical protein
MRQNGVRPSILRFSKETASANGERRASVVNVVPGFSQVSLSRSSVFFAGRTQNRCGQCG